MDGPITFYVIHNCTIIKTIPYVLQKAEQQQSFDIELSIWDADTRGHICSEHGVCDEATIGRNLTLPIFANERVQNIHHIVAPPDGINLNLGALPKCDFRNFWGIFGFSKWWHWVVVILGGVLGIFILLLAYKFGGPIFSCFRWVLPTRRQSNNRRTNKQLQLHYGSYVLPPPPPPPPQFSYRNRQV